MNLEPERCRAAHPLQTWLTEQLGHAGRPALGRLLADRRELVAA
jgi:hypothetical protein